MKKFAIILIFAVILAVGSTAEATYVNIYTLGAVASPDSNQAENPITNVAISIWGSVTIGNGDGLSLWDANASQPIGIYGIGVPLASLGSANVYNLKYDYHFRTYDSSAYDQFGTVLTQGDYLWNGGTIIGSYGWGGGATRGGKETYDLQQAAYQGSIYTGSAANDYYLNVGLITTTDTTNPSWGRFSDFKVEATTIPEPASLSLLGLGLAGLLRFRRKNKVYRP